MFMDEAKKYQVLPLDNSILERLLAPRPSAVAGRTEFTYSGESCGDDCQSSRHGDHNTFVAPFGK